MSHFTRVRTRFTDRELLLTALADVGHPDAEVHERPVRLRNTWGNSSEAEIVVRAPQADFGFTRADDGSYALVADGYALRTDAFRQRLARAYGHAAALRYAMEQGFEVTEDAEQQDGTRRLMLRRTV
ncbi:DUF1257 domain-containing protein [Streptomyces sp. NPDC051940]|uniref:DUF1257 domain-containing protein n=1 Tax=Streptomyces sp. NPDC051940 TaxID=3155675 RepID=UPI00342EFA38